MTEDEQEALSRRHGGGALLLLPLSSGAIAVWKYNGAIEIGQMPTEQQIRKWSQEGTERYRTEDRGASVIVPPAQNAEDLGL